MGLSLASLLLLAAAALLAGFVDSIAGGGGVITVPALLAAGLPPHLALGTNKLQSSFGSFSAMVRYRRGGLVDLRASWWGVAFTAVGAAAGTTAVRHLSAAVLQKVIPILLVAVFVYMVANPQVGRKAGRVVMRPFAFFAVVGTVMGFYDGFFGPGTGSLWAVAFVALAGMNLSQATAATKVMNFTSNAVALGTFVLGGCVQVVPGLIMGVAQMGGAWVGAHLVIKRGSGFVRVFFLVVVALTIARTLAVAYFR